MTVNAKSGFDVQAVNSFLIGGKGKWAREEIKLWRSPLINETN